MTSPLRIGATPGDDELPERSDAFEVPGVAEQEEHIDPATVLADVASELEKDAEETYIALAVPARPDFMVQFGTMIDYDSLRMWIRKARDTKDKTDPHMLRLAFAVLSNTCKAILFKDKPVQAKDGRAFVFQHPEFISLVKPGISNSVPSAIRKFYGGKDGHIIQVMNQVLEEAGYTDIDLDGDNPLTS